MRFEVPGRFEVLEPVGTGGTAAVYRARDQESGTEVALKVLRGLSELDALRLDREAEALASLAHEGIVGYVAHGRTEGGAAALDLDAIDTRTMMIRLAHILALEASGRRDDAHREATRARAEIEKQAAPISDPEQRAAFCEGISLHRDIFAAERRLA